METANKKTGQEKLYSQGPWGQEASTKCMHLKHAALTMVQHQYANQYGLAPMTSGVSVSRVAKVSISPAQHRTVPHHATHHSSASFVLT